MNMKKDVINAIKYLREQNKNVVVQDEWTTKEKLALASAVLESGQEQWSTVSKLIQPFAASHRENNNWCAPKECAKQYCQLLESMEKKKRNDTNDFNFKEQLVKKLTVERMHELQEFLHHEREKQKCLNKLLNEVESGTLDDQIAEIWNCVKDDETFQNYLSNIYPYGIEESETTEVMMTEDYKPRLVLHFRKTSQSDEENDENKEEDNTNQIESDFSINDSVSINTEPAVCDILTLNLPSHLSLTPDSAWIKRSIIIINNVIDDPNSHLFDNVTLAKKDLHYLQVVKYIVNPLEIRQKLRNNEYINPVDFEHDLLMVILNSLIFYPIESPSNKIVRNLFEKISPLFQCLYVEAAAIPNANCDSSVRRSSRQK